MKLVSVIMSTYNTDPHILKQSIASILFQTYSNFEFIIVNDGSTQNDMEIIDSFKDERIVVVNNEENIGLAQSLNKAIQVSNGYYIARMDSDDIAYPDRLSKQVDFLNKNEDIQVVGTFAKNFGKKLNYNVTPLFNKDEVKIQLFTNATLIHPTVMIRKNFLEKFNIKYNKEFICAQDFDIWTRCSEVGEISIIPEVLLYYRVHGKQASIQKRNIQKECAKVVLKRQLQNLNISYSEEEFKLHLMIAGLEELDSSKLHDLNKWIDKIKNKNEIYNKYDSQLLELILKNKILNIFLKQNGVNINTFKQIICNNNARKLLNFYSCKKTIERVFILLHIKIKEIENYI